MQHARSSDLLIGRIALKKKARFMRSGTRLNPPGHINRGRLFLLALPRDESNHTQAHQAQVSGSGTGGRVPIGLPNLIKLMPKLVLLKLMF